MGTPSVRPHLEISDTHGLTLTYARMHDADRTMSRIQSFLLPLIICMYSGNLAADAFRPETDLEDGFLETVEEARIVVFPTTMRDPYLTRYSTESAQRIVDFLNANGIGTARLWESRLALGKPAGGSQRAMFDAAIDEIAAKSDSLELEADYIVMLDILFPPGQGDRLQVFGIHMYMLTADGQSAFSFLLNSHHSSFSSARLKSSGGTAAEKEALAIKSTGIALKELRREIADLRDCIQQEAASGPPAKHVGVLSSYERPVDREKGAGSLAGYSAFNGPRSSASFEIAEDYPARPGEGEGNAVLQLTLDVTSWAGVMQTFGGVSPESWKPLDWSGGVELSFWFRGSNSGARFFVDVLDNRSRCSTADDAERYTYEFVDSFEGWQLISIPFEVMRRKEIYNGAPNDGLGLTSVHGWGIGTIRTRGETTYLIDDVSVRTTPIHEDVPDGLSLDEHVWSPVNELPMFGGYSKSARQKSADEQFVERVLPDFSGDAAAAAEHFAQTGWNAYYANDWSLAMKRFNQAWLLHDENWLALWGFATLSRERGKLQRAFDYYELAMSAGAEDQTLSDEYRQLADQLGQ